MTAVVTTIDVIKEENLMNRAALVGELIRKEIKNQNLPSVAEVRGMGSMIGVELDRPCGELVLRALAAGLVLNVTPENVVRMLPPLVMNEGEAQQGLNKIIPIFKTFLVTRAAA